MSQVATLAPPVPPAVRSRRWSPWLAAPAVFLATLTGSGSASLNGDELATLSAASRSVPGLWALAHNIDGHFLPYYLFMQLWVQAGTAELWLRLPSALAIGVAAWFLADLGRRLHGVPAGLTAATVFAVLPTVSFYGAYARSYAFAAAAVTLSFWALHRAARGHGWVLYGVSVALVSCTHLFAVLALPAHLPVLLSLVPRRTLLLRAAPALAAGAVPALVLGLVGYGARHAISWIPQKGPEVLLKFPLMTTGVTATGVILLAVATAGAALLFARDTDGRPWAGALAGWVVLPPLLLLAVSHLVTPAYVDRYLFVTTPGAALLAGIAAASVPGTVARAAAGCLLVVATLVPGLTRHAELRAHNGRFEDFPGAVRQVRAQAGDAIVFGQSSVRAGFHYYAPAGGPDDVLLLDRAPQPRGFGFAERTDVAAMLADRRRVWLVWRGTKATGSRLPRVRAVREAGFEQVRSWHSAELPGLTVALYARP
ncbi:glycosyltransferase family 39 protein [Nonomuraea sp. NPDC047897]|uniref:glycosyltransferase family 39 protein n=1 Tax=Nonomuraea sp. NPDC047897 TaxID=3364346 RepID=UPI00371BEA8E